MRQVKKPVVSPRLVLAMCALGGAVDLGCSAQVGSVGPGPGGSGPGTGATGSGGNGAGGGAGPGTGGAVSTGGAGACAGTNDPRLVVAPQRLVRLTRIEIANSIRMLFGATEAAAISKQYDIGVDTERTFPPLNSPREGVTIYSSNWTGLDQIASDVAAYVGANFTTVTACPATPTDACATTYLNGLAEKIYRRPLDSGEQTRLTALYTGLKSATVNGVTVTSTVQEATQNVVYALLGTPQFLYRSELGSKTTAPSPTSPGVTLTPAELASQLSFFLTGAPPDPPLLDVANNGTLTNNTVLTAQVNRLLGAQGAAAGPEGAAKPNLTTAISTYYKLNLLGNVGLDPAKYPQFTTALAADMATEAQQFLDYVLWTGNLVDLLTSRTTFLNANLATNLYKVPVPAGATATIFMKTTLPMDQRSGILTNGAFLTSRARTDQGSVIARGLVIKDAMLCVQTPGPPAGLADQIAAARAALPNLTAKQQVDFRAGMPACAACHANFDAYGLVLENYDAIGGWRTVDERQRPVEPATTLPATLGGAKVNNAVEFAQVLASNPGWVNCMAKSVMQYALTDVSSAPVDVFGCAVADVASRYSNAGSKTFTELVRDVATSKTILMRAKAP
ncbi:MAG: DUF1592 domain-containing protein [Myxococcales bacterium]